jgi:hypothetical protein
MGETWTVPAVELVRGKTEGTALIIADGGRKGAARDVEAQLAAGRRVLAMDPLHIGEMNTGYWNWLYALLISSVGDRPLGLQAGQVMAAARWLKDDRGAGPVVLIARGARAGVCALVAAGLCQDAVSGAELNGSLDSLKEVIEKNWSFQNAPELFCFGLLEAFDCKQLAALVAPRPVNSHD